MRNEVSTGRKIWECINPLVFLLVCMIIGSIVFTIYPIMQSVVNMETAEQMTERAVGMTVLVDLVVYSVVIVVKYRTVLSDKFKYIHQSQGWSVLKCILTGAAGFGIGMGLNLLLDWIGLHQIMPEYEQSATMAFSGQNPFLLVLTVGVIGPIAEEMIFRWMIFGRLRFYFGRRWAILVSALLFGAYHMNLVQFIYCTLLGLVLAWLYDRSGNIWIPIGIHMALNIVGVFEYL